MKNIELNSYNDEYSYDYVNCFEKALGMILCQADRQYRDILYVCKNGSKLLY